MDNVLGQRERTLRGAISNRFRASRVSEHVIAGLVAVLDFCAVISAGLFSGYMSYGIWESVYLKLHFSVLSLVALFMAGTFFYAGLYTFDITTSWPKQIANLIALSALAFVLMVPFALGFGISEHISWTWLSSSWLYSVLLIPLIRRITEGAVAAWSSHRHITHKIGVIGATDQAKQWLHDIKTREPARNCVVGVFDDRRTRIGTDVVGYPLLGNLDDVVNYVRKGRLDDVVIALPWNADQRLSNIAARLRELPVGVYLAPDLVGYRFSETKCLLWGGIPVLELASMPFKGWCGVGKLVMDKILVSLLLIVFGPLLALIAIAIKLDSPGPVLFRQERYGFNNQLIFIYKFRTMFQQSCKDGGATQAIRNDPRVTRVGRFLRRTSLDELPQLFNVLNGTMSIVGPRPHPVALNQKFETLIAGYHGRHKVRPGITGWAQINGFRGETETIEKMAARIAYDRFYIENWSMGLDLWILFKTAFLGWSHENAY